jgi:hypothetical protein
MRLLSLFMFSLCISKLFADSTNTDIVNAITSLQTEVTNVQNMLTNSFTRKNGTGYNVANGTTHFMSDFFDFYKYNLLRNDEKEAYLFYMTPPSQNDYIAIYEIARQNQMFQLPFTYYDTMSGTTQSLQTNYLYTTNMYSYQEFLNRSFINPDQINVPIQPTIVNELPRNGQTFQTSNQAYDGLIHTSAVQDMVFKHFYLYCPENYQTVCEMVLSATSSNVFSTSGMNQTSPNGDINAESLLAEAGFTPTSPGHTRARDFIQNITDPFPTNIVPFKPDPSNPGTYIPDTSNIAAIGQNITDKAYRDLSQYVLNEIKNRRVLSTNPAKNSRQSGTLSNLQFLDNMANNRILLSNTWLVDLNTTSTEGLLRELVIIEASRLMLDYQRFRQNEHIEALLAASVVQNQNMLAALNFATPSTQSIQNSLSAVS